MRYSNSVAFAAFVTTQLAQIGLAHAQAYIGVVPIYQTIVALGNQPSDLACQHGEPFPAREVAFLGHVAGTVMQGYWSAVSNGVPPLASFTIDKRTRWTLGATVLDKKSLASIKDPFAAPGSILLAEPLGFIVGGDGLSALGQWQVRDSAGHPAGMYQALFRSRKGTWLLSSLELIDPQTWTDPVMQYCHVPGDVIGYRLQHAREGLAFANPRLVKAQQIEAEARIRADKARAAANAALGNTGKLAAAQAADQKLAAAQNTRRAYQSMADKQRSDLAKAEADQLAIDQRRAAGKAALSGQP